MVGVVVKLGSARSRAFEMQGRADGAGVDTLAIPAGTVSQGCAQAARAGLAGFG